jgi:hypothetical protein
MTRYTGVAGVIAAAILILAHDKLTWTQVGWCWLAAAAAAAIYAGSCWWFPFGRCICCGGKGAHYRKDGKVFRTCKWWCKGSGKRIRLGRRVYNAVERKVKAG